jgi:hypothetical protein
MNNYRYLLSIRNIIKIFKTIYNSILEKINLNNKDKVIYIGSNNNIFFIMII